MYWKKWPFQPVLPVLLTTGILAACTVKEDRSECPCLLVLNVDEMADDRDHVDGLLTVSSDRFLFQEQIDIGSYAGTGYEIEVPRRETISSCAVGTVPALWRSDSLFVREGQEWGRVMHASETSGCNSDICHADMHFHKEYCTVGFILLGVPLGEPYPFEIVLKADCCGIFMKDSAPVRGPYSAKARPSDVETIYSVRVPRQDDGSMLADLARAGEVVSVLDIGAAISAQGYDWKKADLDDVYVTIDYAHATFSVEIVDWDVNEVEETI